MRNAQRSEDCLRYLRMHLQHSLRDEISHNLSSRFPMFAYLFPLDCEVVCVLKISLEASDAKALPLYLLMPDFFQKIKDGQ